MFCLSLVIYDDPVFFMQKSMLYLKWTSKTSALVHIKNAAVTVFARENAERFLFKNDEYVKYFEMTSTLLELWWWQSVLVEFSYFLNIVF